MIDRHFVRTRAIGGPGPGPGPGPGGSWVRGRVVWCGLAVLAVLYGPLAMTCLLPLAGCGDASSPAGASAAGAPKAAPASYPYKIGTTIGMITDIVRQVAGDKAQVTGVIGESVDPHLFRASSRDVATLMSADVVLYNGLLLEGKMADTLIEVASKREYVFRVTSLIDSKYLLEPEEFQGHYDPHVWMDVAAWMKAVDAVSEKLGDFDPPNASYYAANAARYTVDLEKLHTYATDTIATIPKAQRVMITAHDAFNYFGRAYEVEVMGIQGLSTESEAGLERINGLVDMIVQRDIKAVFVESSVSSKNVDALREGAAARGKQVREGGTLFSDAMGAPGTYEGTYIGMIDHNVTTVARALGGQSPLRGLNGKLQDTAAHE